MEGCGWGPQLKLDRAIKAYSCSQMLTVMHRPHNKMWLSTMSISLLLPPARSSQARLRASSPLKSAFEVSLSRKGTETMPDSSKLLWAVTQGWQVTFTGTIYCLSTVLLSQTSSSSLAASIVMKNCYSIMSASTWEPLGKILCSPALCCWN